MGIIFFKVASHSKHGFARLKLITTYYSSFFVPRIELPELRMPTGPILSVASVIGK
jgi:hypothetical protein